MIPLAPPLIRLCQVGQFYFGDPTLRWVNFQPALIVRQDQRIFGESGRLVASQNLGCAAAAFRRNQFTAPLRV